MDKLIEITSNPVLPVLDLLLKDKTTSKNIIWATDSYEELGEGFADKDPISRNLLLQHSDCIMPRIQKSLEAKQNRTRKKAEVFTPAWLCNAMNNHCDEVWFGRKDVFNVEHDDHTWTPVEGPISFPEAMLKLKTPAWQKYVDTRRLEITCGEAPYLVSRYDMANGERILPLKRRIGQLDRKLRIVNENAQPDEWMDWVQRAFEACYGYEYQGDNLLIARINLLMTFVEYYRDRWGEDPSTNNIKIIANRIVWNLWQMDGLKDTVPLGKPCDEYKQMDLFGNGDEANKEERVAVPCKIHDWRWKTTILFHSLKK